MSATIKHVVVTNGSPFGPETLTRYDVGEDAKTMLRYESGKEMALFVSVPDSGPDGEKVDFSLRIVHPRVTLDEYQMTFEGFERVRTMVGEEDRYEKRVAHLFLVPLSADGEV